MSKTVVIQIGNSDDKLTQKEWSEFCVDLYQCGIDFCKQIHFFGASDAKSEWQNACLVAEIAENQIENLKLKLGQLAARNIQNSIAMTLGETEFVEAWK